MKVTSFFATYNRKVSSLCRKFIENKKFRTILNTFLASIVLFGGTIAQSDLVFGQTEPVSEISSPISFVATEEIILTTKQASRLPIIGPLSQGFSFYHPGIDIESPFNTPIFPFLSGSIAETGYAGGYGNFILIDHLNGYFSLYAHLNNVFIKKDDQVAQDTTIGTVGLTGYTTGAHLHLEIYENGIAVNPLTILPESPFASSSGNIAFGGGQQSISSKTLMVPIAQQMPIYATASVSQATVVEKKEEKKVEKPDLGIWLPSQLNTTNRQAGEAQGGSKAKSLLPTLGGL